MIEKKYPKIEPHVIDKIREEEKKFKWSKEFGGYLIVENDTITDVIFDVEKSSMVEVTLGINNILKIPEEQRNNVQGWFHKHNINNLSQLDIEMVLQLTRFWNECYTLVLQRNGFLLLLKTVMGLDLIYRKQIIIETHRRVIKYKEGPYGIIHIPQSIKHFQHR